MKTEKTESVKQFSDRVGIGVETIRKFCRQGMPHHMGVWGGEKIVYVIHVEAALEWLEDKRAKTLEAAKR